MKNNDKFLIFYPKFTQIYSFISPFVKKSEKPPCKQPYIVTIC